MQGQGQVLTTDVPTYQQVTYPSTTAPRFHMGMVKIGAKSAITRTFVNGWNNTYSSNKIYLQCTNGHASGWSLLLNSNIHFGVVFIVLPFHVPHVSQQKCPHDATSPIELITLRFHQTWQ